MRKSLRRLKLGQATYLWKVEHAHHVLPPPQLGEAREGRCREVFTAFLEGHRAAPLRVMFTDGEGAHAGYPNAGVVWTSAEPKLDLNLNLPSVACQLIEAALADGFAPATQRAPFVVEDGFGFAQRLGSAPG